MKSKYCITAFLLIISIFACAQDNVKIDNEKSYSIGLCNISFNALDGSSFSTLGKMGQYFVPLRDQDTILVTLVCFTDATQDMVEGITGGYVYNGQWVSAAKQVNQVEKVFYLSGENWTGVLTVQPSPPRDPNEYKPSPLVAINILGYCLKETNGRQMLCGNYFTLIEGDLEQKRLIESLKTITFVETGASKK